MLQIVIYGLISIAIILTLIRLTPLWDRLLSPTPAGFVEFDTLTPPKKPNWYLLCKADICQHATVKAEPPIFDLPSTDLKGRLEKLLLEIPNTVVRGDNGTQMDILVRTPVMRWPDIISVEFVPLGEGKSTLYIYSRSIYGRSDLGANKARITNWLKRLQS